MKTAAPTFSAPVGPHRITHTFLMSKCSGCPCKKNAAAPSSCEKSSDAAQSTTALAERAPSTVEAGKAPVKPKLGLFDGISTIVGLMVGSGIFSSSEEIHTCVQSAGMAMSIWLITGLLSLAGALCYAELGTLIPGSGGEAQYLQKVFGPLATFMFNWTSIALLKPGTVSVMSEGCATYALRLLRNLIDFDLEDRMEFWARKGIAVIIIVLVTLASSLSPKASLKLQEYMTYGKILALGFIITMTGYHLGFGDRANFSDNLSTPFKGTNWNIMGYAGALNDGLFSFDGWNNLNIIAGDVANPGRTLPMAIWISMALVIGLYMLTIFGYYAVLPASTVAHSSTIGIEFGKAVASTFGAILMPIFVINSTFGSALSSMVTSSEIVVLAADMGHIPKMFGRINKTLGTAFNAYIMQGVLAALILLCGDGFSGLVTIYAVPTWIFYAACVVALLVLRFREPNAHRPYKVWLTTPILFLAACTYLLVTTAISKGVPFWIGLGVLLSAVPVYYLFVRN